MTRIFFNSLFIKHLKNGQNVSGNSSNFNYCRFGVFSNELQTDIIFRKRNTTEVGTQLMTLLITIWISNKEENNSLDQRKTAFELFWYKDAKENSNPTSLFHPWSSFHNIHYVVLRNINHSASLSKFFNGILCMHQ